MPARPAYDASRDEWLVIDDAPQAQAGVIADRLDFLEARHRERVGG